MTQAFLAGGIAFGITVSCVCCVVIAAHMWRPRERLVLLSGIALASIVLFMGCVTLVSIGGNDARLTLTNESPWPVEVTAVNVKPQVIEPGESHEFVQYGGPGWIDGLIDDIELRGGEGFAARILIQGLIEGRPVNITVRAETFEREESNP